MCEKLLSQVQIAGAGAGKTYSLAEKVLMWYDNKKDDKIIYVITFTNDAKCNIIQRVFELNNGQVPANICIDVYKRQQYPVSRRFWKRN